MKPGDYLVIITESIYSPLRIGDICVVDSYHVCRKNLSVKNFFGTWIQEQGALHWTPINKTKLLELILEY